MRQRFLTIEPDAWGSWGKSLLATLLLTLACCLTSGAEPLTAKDSNGILLAFRIKVSLPDGAKKVKLIEIAPRVVVGDGKAAEVKVSSPDSKSVITLKTTPTLGPTNQVTIAMTVSANLGGASVTRKIRLVTALGSPAMVEIDDERKREKLSVEVTPSRYKPSDG